VLLYSYSMCGYLFGFGFALLCQRQKSTTWFDIEKGTGTSSRRRASFRQCLLAPKKTYEGEIARCERFEPCLFFGVKVLRTFLVATFI